MMFSVVGKAGLVTGASGGLGRASAIALAAQGATVVAIARNEKGLQETVDLAGGSPGKIVGFQADVTDEDQVRAAIDACGGYPGGLRYVVNNAGASIEQSLLDTTNEQWDHVQDVNVRAVFWVCKYAVGAMLERGCAGSIVNIASVLSMTADPMLTAYTTSKHAVLGLTRSIAVSREYARAGIRANAICPGDMDTPMVQQYFASLGDPDEARARISSSYPVERIADPAEIAAAVVFLVSDASSFINGSSLVIDGGLTASLYTSA
jgi:NAD(P)-dependent dehydrogenase (short-subunit alcohol dehydrogenase family)